MIELKGAPVVKELVGIAQTGAQALAERNVTPTLAIVRVGADPGDIWYENAAIKRLSKAGAETSVFALEQDATMGELEQLVESLAYNPEIHGILPLRPFPKRIDEQQVLTHIPACKDVDGAGAQAMEALYAGKPGAFAPCTAEAAMHLLTYYGCELEGAHAVVCGRSLVVGKPLSLLLLNQNATVSVIHSKTLDRHTILQNADVVMAAMGAGPRLTAQDISPNAWVVDIATREENGEMVGDVDIEENDAPFAALSPVPGGVGPVTTAVLAHHVILAAQQQTKQLP